MDDDTATADAALAAELADHAGKLLVRIRAADDGRDPAALGRAGDQQSNEFLLAELARQRPDDAVLSEESADSSARLTASRVWIIDPLDGTREFTLPGRSDWAVHVGLHTASVGITAAAVAMPALGRVWSTTSSFSSSSLRSRPILLVSDSRPPSFAGAVASAVGAELRTMGSAGAKAMAVVRGDADGYVHAGGQWEWDSAAPVGVALAAGLVACRIDGSPLLYNQAKPYLPDLLICRPGLAGPVLDAIKLASGS
jgi:3'(2'), 5'-bisphosphate nucleotidase